MPDLDRVRATLEERGPIAGAELHAAVGGEVFGLWKACHNSDEFVTQVVGRRYLRLDRTVEGFARLSPSILREFLTYCVVGLPSQREQLTRAAKLQNARIVAISKAKLRVAERFVDEVLEVALGNGLDLDQFCILIGGDVVYQMSHDVARQESSSGARVDGSDLDLVVLASDEVPDSMVEAVDDAIRSRKWLYLRSPALREEVDYIVKRFARLEEQAAFDSFQHMVACKVFDEAQFLRGNRELHERGRQLLAERGVLDRLRELEADAVARRARRQEFLAGLEGEELPAAGQQQFYSNEEAAEFERLR